MLFQIGTDELTIRFQGVEQLWALRRKLTVRRDQVKKVSFYSQWGVPKREIGYRVGGFGLPGVLYAGVFIGNKGKNFLFLRRPKRLGDSVQLSDVLNIRLTTNAKYRRILITLEDPQFAEQINGWWLSIVQQPAS